nr:hypothetical protein [uncultured Flavobacterium sp.]
MKKLITICLFMATAFAVNAQVKKTTATKTPVKKVAKTETAVAPVQQKGPTKEQTIAFIKDYFKTTPPRTGTYEENKNVHKNRIFSDYDIVFDTKNVLTINYNEHLNYISIDGNDVTKMDHYIRTKYILDFSKIEKIELTMGNDLGIYEIHLSFIATPNYNFGFSENMVTVSNITVDGKLVKRDSEKTFNDVSLPDKIEERKQILIPIQYIPLKVTNYDYEAGNKKILQAFNHLRKLCGAPEPIDFGN